MGIQSGRVKKFLAIGKAAADPVPFDHPERMEDWARRHLDKVTQRLKNGIEQAMGKLPAETEASEENTPIEIPDVHEHELGMEQQLAGYRREFMVLSKLREKALRDGEFSRASNYFDQQQKVSSEIRQLERLLPTVLEQRGDYQRTAVVRATTVEFLTVLKRSLLGRAGKASARLRAAQSDAEITEAWRTEINAVFRECCGASFGEILTLE